MATDQFGFGFCGFLYISFVLNYRWTFRSIIDIVIDLFTPEDWYCLWIVTVPLYVYNPDYIRDPHACRGWSNSRILGVLTRAARNTGWRGPLALGASDGSGTWQRHWQSTSTHHPGTDWHWRYWKTGMTKTTQRLATSDEHGTRAQQDDLKTITSKYKTTRPFIWPANWRHQLSCILEGLAKLPH